MDFAETCQQRNEAMVDQLSLECGDVGARTLGVDDGVRTVT